MSSRIVPRTDANPASRGMVPHTATAPWHPDHRAALVGEEGDVAELHPGSLGFDAFLRERAGRLWRAAWLLTGDAQHAEDLVQTALVKTFGRYPAMNDDDHYEAYVRQTIHRTFVSWWRRRSWRGEVASDSTADAAGRALDPDVSMDVARALAELPRMQRSVVVLRYFEDRPVAEVAALLGISEGTVKSYAHRACESLRGSLHLAQDR